MINHHCERAMPKISTIRDRSFERQAGLCFYCEQPMWRADPDAFARQQGLSPATARWLQASAEHLHARRDGGGDAETNIVAACVYCNRHRHMARVPLSPTSFQRRVKSRLAAGK